jgi:hypothetical protein
MKQHWIAFDVAPGMAGRTLRRKEMKGWLGYCALDIRFLTSIFRSFEPVSPSESGGAALITFRSDAWSSVMVFDDVALTLL